MVDKTHTGKLIFSKELNKGNLRTRDYLLSLVSKVKNPENSILLEVGCGNGRFEYLLSENFKSYTGIDPSLEYVKIAKETTKSINSRYFVGFAEDIPLKEKFDVILYAFSWHFVTDFKKAIQETKRVLEKEGIVIIMEPSKESNSWASQKLIRGSKEFDEKSYNQKMNALDKARKELELFEKAGFMISEERIDDGAHSNVWTLNLKTLNVP